MDHPHPAEYIVRRYGIPFPTLIHNVPEMLEVKQGWDLHERLDIPPTGGSCSTRDRSRSSGASRSPSRRWPCSSAACW